MRRSGGRHDAPSGRACRVAGETSLRAGHPWPRDRQAVVVVDGAEDRNVRARVRRRRIDPEFGREFADDGDSDRLPACLFGGQLHVRASFCAQSVLIIGRAREPLDPAVAKAEGAAGRSGASSGEPGGPTFRCGRRRPFDRRWGHRRGRSAPLRIGDQPRPGTEPVKHFGRGEELAHPTGFEPVTSAFGAI